MRVGRRLRLTAILALTATSLTVTSALPGAADRPGGDVVVTATTSSGGGSPDGDGGGGGGPVCRQFVGVADDSRTPIYGPTGQQFFSGSGRWLAKDCDGDAYHPELSGVTVGIPGFGTPVTLIPEGGLVDVFALALEAKRRLPLGEPPVQTAPPAADQLYVSVPTWLWLDPGYWRPYTATATAGRVVATVTARPTSVAWSMGDGSTVRCAGPGTPWRPDASTSCSHTYTWTSARAPGGEWPVTATVTFSVVWTANVIGGGTLGSVTRSSTFPVTVGEIQAINDDPGGS